MKDELKDILVKSLSLFLTRVGDLLKVKNVLSILGAVVFAYLSLKGKLEPKDSLLVITMIFQAYFGFQNSKQPPQQ